MRDLALAVLAHLVLGQALALAQDDPGAQLLAEALVGDADHLHVEHLGVGVEELLDLARVDVLAAADHHVLDAADDVAVALVVDHREVTGVHPAAGVDRFLGLGLVVPVAEHHRVAAGAQLARLAARHDAALVVDDLHLQVRLDAADGGHAAVDGVVGAALEAHRRGLGHAVGDGHLGHVHLADHPLHDLDRARAAGHDACAQAGEIEVGKARMIERGDEHRRHAIEAGAFLLRHRLQHRQRLEGLGRVDHGGAVGEAAEVAHHHAEAVVQRHRDAHAVARHQLDRLADEEAVVEDVVVRQRRALGVAGGAGGELDVDRVVELQPRRQQRQRSELITRRRDAQTVEIEHAWRSFAAHADHELQRRQRMAAQQTGFTMAQLGRQFGKHFQVVAALEGRRQDQRAAPHLVERVFEFGATVSRVDVHQRQPGLGGGELGQRPFGVVLRPDADAITRREAQSHQAAGQRIDALA